MKPWSKRRYAKGDMCGSVSPYWLFVPNPRKCKISREWDRLTDQNALYMHGSHVKLRYTSRRQGARGAGMAGLLGGVVQWQRMWAWRDGLQVGVDDCRLRGNECGPEGMDRGI